MKLEEQLNMDEGLIRVLLEWSSDTDCKPLRVLKPTWYTVSSDTDKNKTSADVGKTWIADESNHKDLACQKDRYKQFLKWVEDSLELNKENYRIPSLESTDDTDDNDENDNNDNTDSEGCVPFNQFMADPKREPTIFRNKKCKETSCFIPLNQCLDETNVYFYSKEQASEETGNPESDFEMVVCYFCDDTTSHEWKYKKFYRQKTDAKEEVESCDGFVIFYKTKGEDNLENTTDDIEVCKTTDARRLKLYLGIEPYDLRSHVNQDKIYNLTGKYGNEIYNECIVESPYWSGRDTEFRVRTSCIAKYKDLLKQVMPSDDDQDPEDEVAGLSQLLEPFNAEVTMCLDKQCNETISVYKGDPQSFINSEIASWSQGSSERMNSMTKRFASKKQSIDSWLKNYLSTRLQSQIDWKNFPFLTEPANWPDQNVINVIENSIALLLTNPISLKRIDNEGKAYIKIENANPELDGRYIVYFDTGSLLPKKIVPVYGSENADNLCAKFKQVVQLNNFKEVDKNTYLEKSQSLEPNELKFAQQMRRYMNGYGKWSDVCLKDAYFLPIE